MADFNSTSRRLARSLSLRWSVVLGNGEAMLRNGEAILGGDRRKWGGGLIAIAIAPAKHSRDLASDTLTAAAHERKNAATRRRETAGRRGGVTQREAGGRWRSTFLQGAAPHGGR